MVAAAGVQPRHHRLRPRCRPLPAHRRGPPRRHPRRATGLRRHPAGGGGPARRLDRRPPRPPRAGSAPPAALRARPLREPPSLRRARRAHRRRTATSSSSARTPRAPTRARAASCARRHPYEVATQGSVNTRMGVERCVRFAFELAGASSPASPHPGAQDQRPDLLRRPVATGRGRGAGRVPRCEPRLQPRRRSLHLSGRAGPTRYDVIVTDNLFGDILTDLAGAVAGGIGFAASANLNPARTGPVALRAGPRRRPRHRRHGRSQPARRHSLGGAHARASGRRPPPPSGSPRRSPPTWPSTLPTALRSRPPSPSATPSQKGSEPVPITPTEKIWIDGELVDWDKAQRPRAHPLAPLRLGRVRGHPGLPDQPAGWPCSGSPTTSSASSRRPRSS